MKHQKSVKPKVLALTVLAGLCSQAWSQSEQKVEAPIATINTAVGRGTAKMNLSSTQTGTKGTNKQSTKTKGVILNAAVMNATATLDMASVSGGVTGTNQQRADVWGGVINGAAVG